MVNDAPSVRPAGRYSVGETAALLGIHRNTLRRYTDAGSIRCSFGKHTLRKYYTGVEILRFWNAM